MPSRSHRAGCRLIACWRRGAGWPSGICCGRGWPIRSMALRSSGIEDLNSFGVGGLTSSMLSEWGSGSNDVTVIATVRKRDLDRLRASRDVHHEQLRDLLAVAVQHDAVLTVPNVHTRDEWERIRRLYPDEEVEGCLGDHLFRADKLLERFCDARDDANGQPGYAVTLACALLNLKGLHWVPRELLLQFGREVLGLLRSQDEPAGESEARGGLRFALDERWDYARPLLHEASTPGAAGPYRARQVIVDYVREHEPLPGSTTVTWARIVDQVDAWDLLDVAVAAVDQRNAEIARAAWGRALRSQAAPVAGWAAIELASIASREGDDEEAERLLRRALEVDDPDVRPRAARMLGELLIRRGNQSAAQSALELAGQFGHPDEQFRALLWLGTLHLRREALTEAERLLKLVVDSRHYDAAPQANVSLGDLLRRAGRVEDAEAAYRAALDSGHPKAAPDAAWRFAQIAAGQGKLDEADDWHRQAVAMSGDELRLVDEVELGRQFEGAGHHARAATLYRRVQEAPDAMLRTTARSGQSLAALMATVEYSWRLRGRNPWLAAKLLDDARRRDGWPVHPPTAERLHQELAKALEAVIRGKDSARIPEAAVMLGSLYRERGADRQAIEAFRVALPSTVRPLVDREHTSLAALAIADLAIERGDWGEAEDMLELVVELRHEDCAPEAALRLGRRYIQTGRFPDARRVLRQVARYGNPEALRGATEELRGIEGKGPPDPPPAPPTGLPDDPGPGPTGEIGGR